LQIQRLISRYGADQYPPTTRSATDRGSVLCAADDAEQAFLLLGDGAERWLGETCSTGVARVRAKMAGAMELAAMIGATRSARRLGMAALAGRFAENDLASIIDHLGRAEVAEDPGEDSAQGDWFLRPNRSSNTCAPVTMSSRRRAPSPAGSWVGRPAVPCLRLHTYFTGV
jgi:hypothetical protein